ELPSSASVVATFGGVGGRQAVARITARSQATIAGVAAETAGVTGVAPWDIAVSGVAPGKASVAGVVAAGIAEAGVVVATRPEAGVGIAARPETAVAPSVHERVGHQVHELVHGAERDLLGRSRAFPGKLSQALRRQCTENAGNRAIGIEKVR